MTDFIAALPMYDWPERRAEVDAQWAAIRARLRAAGVEAPERLVRRNADMPAVPGGIRDAMGRVIAADPATLPPDEFDLPTLWRHPRLLFAQACWGPLETTGLAGHVEVVGQPDYSDVDGGEGVFYSSAVLMRGNADAHNLPAPADGSALLPAGLLQGARFAFNSEDSMSGFLAPTRDLAAQDYDLALFAELVATGDHRASIRAVAEGRADVTAIDCLSWALAKRFEPAARGLVVVGWTARRKGLPFIAARPLAPLVADLLADGEVLPSGISAGT